MSEALKKECMWEELKELSPAADLDENLGQEALQALVQEARGQFYLRLGDVRCRPYVPPQWEYRLEEKLKQTDV